MTIEQLNELKQRLVLIGVFDIDNRLIQIEDKEQLAADPSLWSNNEKAEQLLKSSKNP